MPHEMGVAPPSIYDYAIIGDCRSAALVSRDGSIDWLCWPRFDSPSLFGAILDPVRGGRFAVRPVGHYTVSRRYLDATNILESTFTTNTGRLRVVDLMPVSSEGEKRCALSPDAEVLRLIDGLDGCVQVEVIFDPRPGYGQRRPLLENRGSFGVVLDDRDGLFTLRAEPSLQGQLTDEGLRALVTIGAGDDLWLSLSAAHRDPAILPPLGVAGHERLERSIRWWRAWAERGRYDGPYREQVIRSALTLKLMTYAPSGAVVAAPTTSLPERLGGVRNWDYRYCWLRDASLTLRALYSLGYLQEGTAFLSWLLHATRLTWPELQILYDVFGGTRLPERALPQLAGFSGSRPVRVGNDAAGQLQLDVYGEVVDAAYRFVQIGGRLDRAMARALVNFGRTVCRRWQEPDEGIWEVRSGRRHHTYSKFMCWVALDRLLSLHDAGHLTAPEGIFRNAREAIFREIETRGYNGQIHSYVSVFDGGNDVDASLLLMVLYGYPAGRNRLRGTCARVRDRLGTGPLLYRYRDIDDGLPGREGAFGICSFWGAECLARLGDVQGATAAFEGVCQYSNDLGLFAEEIDPATGDALGNFPQAFTHVGLINAAITLRGDAGSQTMINGRTL
jgi:GH15 family glucan-1,4-alpha-glucosidase